MKDLAGQRFGRLVAIEPTDKRVDQLVVWRCRCDCGNVCEAVSSSLIKGNTRSCGCLRREGRIRDITGERFGRLVVEGPTDKRLRGAVVWRCRCDCGNACEAPTTTLRSGQVRSCGCLRRESNAKDLAGKRFGRLVAVRPVGKRGRYVLWECRCDCGNAREATTSQLTGGKVRSCGCLRGRRKPAGPGPGAPAGTAPAPAPAQPPAPAPAATPARPPAPAPAPAVGSPAAAQQPARDLAGRRFGRLVAVDAAGPSADGGLTWRCLCDCNRVAEATSLELESGAKASCGQCG